MDLRLWIFSLLVVCRPFRWRVYSPCSFTDHVYWFQSPQLINLHLQPRSKLINVSNLPTKSAFYPCVWWSKYGAEFNLNVRCKWASVFWTKTETHSSTSSSIQMLISGPAAAQTPFPAHQSAVIKFHEGVQRGWKEASKPQRKATSPLIIISTSYSTFCFCQRGNKCWKKGW